MIHALKEMPDEYELKDGPQTDIREHFEDLADPEKPGALFVVRKRVPFEHVVGLAGIYPEGNKAILSEVCVSERGRGHNLGKLLVQECIEWADEQQVELIQVDVVPDPDNRANKILSDLEFVPDLTGKLVLRLGNEDSLLGTSSSD